MNSDIEWRKFVMTSFDLQNRIAFVTGGNGGIGLGMAKGFALAGASVVIAGRNKTKAQSALSELRATGAQAEFVDLDVLQEASCKRAIEQAIERFGRLDILVNNAGTTVRKQPQDLTAEDWHQVMDTNLTGAFLCSKMAYAPMVRAGGGKIINIRLFPQSEWRRLYLPTVTCFIDLLSGRYSSSAQGVSSRRPLRSPAS
jgi:2-dehydro-3-deoxy-D-gluconate 5-dehydrogenase